MRIKNIMAVLARKGVMIAVFSSVMLVQMPLAIANKTECGSSACSCEAHRCSTCAGYYCTGNPSITCSAHGTDMSCGQWCADVGNTSSQCKGQNGASECCTIS